MVGACERALENILSWAVCAQPWPGCSFQRRACCFKLSGPESLLQLQGKVAECPLARPHMWLHADLAPKAA